MADGRVVTDIETADDFTASGFGPLISTLDTDTAKVARTVKPGDVALRENLLARLRGENPSGRALRVDLDMLSVVREGDADWGQEGYLDLQSGAVYPADSVDESTVGADAVIDVDAEPERWLRIDSTGSHDAWNDMAEFAARQRDARLREQLERVIEGKGAFRRFRDIVHETGLGDHWNLFSEDRQLGRARAFLAENDIRVA